MVRSEGRVQSGEIWEATSGGMGERLLGEEEDIGRRRKRAGETTGGSRRNGRSGKRKKEEECGGRRSVEEERERRPAAEERHTRRRLAVKSFELGCKRKRVREGGGVGDRRRTARGGH